MDAAKRRILKGELNMLCSKWISVCGLFVVPLLFGP